MAFIPNPSNLPYVNHKNGKRDDNRVENLEWCDGVYNVWHSYHVLNNTNGKDKAVVQLTKDKYFVNEYKSINEAHRKTSVSVGSIVEVCKNNAKRKTAGGYKWMYKEEYLKYLNTI